MRDELLLKRDLEELQKLIPDTWKRASSLFPAGYQKVSRGTFEGSVGPGSHSDPTGDIVASVALQRVRAGTKHGLRATHRALGDLRTAYNVFGAAAALLDIA